MHMADALLAPAVAGVMYGLSASAIGVSAYKLRKEEKLTPSTGMKKLPTMAVMAAMVFAGQMINYTIPGTGSSGHLCGGMLLSAVLGPWAGFLSMVAVLTIQCLFFADGGLMALGANFWNMAFYGCFVGYFLIFRPIMKSRIKSVPLKLALGSVVGCIVTLQLGAFSVVLETQASGITEIPFAQFATLMQPIHLAIGLIEGLITTAVLEFVYAARPEMLKITESVGEKREGKLSFKTTIIVIACAVLVIGGGLSLIASSNPDGLEWALFGNSEYSEDRGNLSLDEEDYGASSGAADAAQSIQDKTAFMPDYDFAAGEGNGTTVAGITGSVIVAAVAGLICLPAVIRKRKG